MEKDVNLNKPTISPLNIKELKGTNGGGAAGILAGALLAVVLWGEAVDFVHEVGEELGEKIIEASRK